MVIRNPDQRAVQGGYADLDDRLLVLDFQAGNVEAFAEICRRYGGLARHVCLRFLPNQADADEALQETLIRVFQGLYRFNGRYALKPWIARVAKNVSLDILRGRARRPQTDPVPAAEELADPEDEADRIVERLVQRDTVLQVMAELPETHRRALVLREIDGYSHRDIARELGMSSAQAKALIHRARAGFRRRWLERVSDGGGLKGLLFLPLLWSARLAGGVRRIGERAGQLVGSAAQTAQAAAPEALTSSFATSAPAAASLSERVVAAGMTLLVAGSVTVGAAKLVQDRDRPDLSDVAGAAAVVAQVPVHGPKEQVETPVEAPSVQRIAPVDRIRPVVGPDEPVEDPQPPVDPSPSTDPTPSVDPSPGTEPSPSPEPSPEPPPVPPAPAWSGSFSIDWASGDLCGCGPGVGLTSSSSTGTLGEGQVVVSQAFSGAASDAEGDAAWEIDADLDATLGEGSGTVDLVFELKTEEGRFYFAGSASGQVVSGATGGGESVAYALSGNYTLSGAGGELSPIPNEGVFTVQLDLWQDGATVYGVDIDLRR